MGRPRVGIRGERCVPSERGTRVPPELEETGWSRRSSDCAWLGQHSGALAAGDPGQVRRFGMRRTLIGRIRRSIGKAGNGNKSPYGLMQDSEMIAQELSALGHRVDELDRRLSDVEKVNRRLEEAALNTARAMAEISEHWDAVYEAMRRRDESQEAGT